MSCNTAAADGPLSHALAVIFFNPVPGVQVEVKTTNDMKISAVTAPTVRVYDQDRDNVVVGATVMEGTLACSRGLFRKQTALSQVSISPSHNLGA